MNGDVNWYLAEIKGVIEGNENLSLAFSAYNEALNFRMILGFRDPNVLDLNLSLAKFYTFLNNPDQASNTVDMIQSTFSVPKLRAATSLLSFEGGIGFLEDLERVKKKIEKLKNMQNDAGSSNVGAAKSPEAPHF